MIAGSELERSTNNHEKGFIKGTAAFVALTAIDKEHMRVFKSQKEALSFAGYINLSSGGIEYHLSSLGRYAEGKGGYKKL